MNRKKIIRLLLLIGVVFLGWLVYNKQVSPTTIALVHYQDNSVAGMVKAAENYFI